MRKKIKINDVNLAIDDVIAKMFQRLNEKGDGTFASIHEIHGVLQEEMYELEKAIHENLSDKEKIEELADIAVGAIFAIACIKTKSIDW